MNKLNLKWNNFELNASKSISSLRKESDFFDVILVSDDENEVEAHKVVLSACSPFFKKLLSGKNHPKPMLYMTGVSFANLNLVLDYIYHGEVQVEQVNLESFLSVAKKLKLEGLQEIGNKDLEVENEKVEFPEQSFLSSILMEEFNEVEEEVSAIEVDIPETKTKTMPTVFDQDSNIQDVERRIEKLRERLEDGLYKCKSCGKVSKTKQIIGRHIEARHLDGLSFSCKVCCKKFR